MKFFKSVKTFIFYSISVLWDTIYRIRRFCYDYGITRQYSFHVPIISVGNLTFGGTGKTPFTLWISEYVAKKNKKVMILMRGYKGKLENSHGLIKSNSKMVPDPVLYGDEALLYARKLKNASVVVGKKRAQNLEYYFPEEKPDLVVLDDGHQHITIKRNLNFVLFDLMQPLSIYEVAPLGFMREGLSALKDADLIVLARADLVDEEKKQSLKKLIRPHLAPRTPIAEIRYVPNGLLDTSFNLKMKAQELNGKKVICLAGIASPQSFFKMIEELGAQILVTESFPDHHYFKLEELKSFIDYAKAEDALIVTTEKDIVRIKQVVDDPVFCFLDIRVDFLKAEDETKLLIDNLFLGKTSDLIR